MQLAGRYPVTARLFFGRWTAILSLALVPVVAASCAPRSRALVPAGTAEPDKFLFDRGTAALNDKKWLTSREFFKQLVETYTQSAYRPDAKLAVGDTYMGEGSGSALVLAINEFQEFLSFYPTSPRADYAQYQMGLAHFRQMRSSQRDQTETRAAARDFEAFMTRFPASPLLPAAKTKLRESRDRLGEAEYDVGYYYYRIHWYPGSIDRFKSLLERDPDYTKRDAVYFYLGESLVLTKKQAEALPYYDRLLQEFDNSEFLPEARKRVAELKSLMATQ